MQLVYFGMLLTAFLGALFSEWLGPRPNESALGSCLGIVVVFGLIGKFLASRARRRIEQTHCTRFHLMEFEKQRQWILWLWIATAPIFLSFVGWGAYSYRIFPEAGSLSLTFMWWCFPSVLLMTLLDAARYQLYRYSEFKHVSGARYGWLVLMIPCFLTCVLWDAMTILSTSILGIDQTSPMLIACLLTLLLAVTLPFLMVKCWSTERFKNDRHGAIVVSAWTSVGGHPRSIRLWKTDMSIAGAMVFGWCSPFRFLLISDLLLEKLAPDELRMIVLHEAAHCKRWHVWLRLLPVWIMSLPLLAIHQYDGVQTCVVLGSLVSMCVLLSWIARWTEFDADRMAIRLTEGFSSALPLEQPNTADSFGQRSTFSQQMAARALIRALEKLTPASYRTKDTWLHPSLDRRIKSLKQHYFNQPSMLVESVDDVSCLSSPF